MPVSYTHLDVYKRQMLGRARQVKVTKEDTTIVDGMGDKKAIADRVAQIKACLLYTSRCV